MLATFALSLVAFLLTPLHARPSQVPQDDLVLTDGMQLEGTIHCNDLLVPAGVRVGFADDLELLVHGDAVIEGVLEAAPRPAGSAASDAPNLLLSCQGQLYVGPIGILAGADGSDGMSSDLAVAHRTGGVGSNITLQAARFCVLGTVVTGSGGAGGIGHDGGRGGALTVIGEPFVHPAAGGLTGPALLRTGRGGHGGPGENAGPLSILPGDGGDGGPLTFKRPEPSAATTSTSTDACGGENGSPGATMTGAAIGGDGGDGGDGPDGTAASPDGLPGGDGGNGAAVTGAAGGDGGPGENCYQATPPSRGGDGGDGGEGQDAVGGRGGNGGQGGKGYPGAAPFLGKGGKGGDAGYGASAVGGNGGKAGNGGSGCPPGTVGARASGGLGTGGAAGTPGAGGVGSPMGRPGNAGGAGSSTPGAQGGPGSFGTNCCGS